MLHMAISSQFLAMMVLAMVGAFSLAYSVAVDAESLSQELRVGIRCVCQKCGEHEGVKVF